MNPILKKLFAASALALSVSCAFASPSGLVISQVYGGGGNSGATLKNDFIELFNASSAPITLTGYAVQYTSATGTGTWTVTTLTGSIPAGGYYLVQEAVGAGGTVNLPTPDATGTIAMSGTAGKVALTSTVTALTGTAPITAAVIDMVGYGATNIYEGSAPASGLSNTLADLRLNAGCTDTDNNAADFAPLAPSPRNTASAKVDCSTVVPPPPVDNNPVAARIHEIQGKAHRSPLEGRNVIQVPGVVTAVRSTGFYMEDPLPDNDPATSEGVFVYTVTTPAVSVGQYLIVAGVVTEFRPGGSDGTGNLTTTEITTPTWVSGGAAPALPAPIVIGLGGRMPPTVKFASTTTTGSVEEAGYAFDAVNNGVDFYESLESMRVVVNNAVVTGPTDANNETPIIGDNGAFATGRSARGGIVITATDYNPERMLIDDALLPTGAVMPQSNVGDLLSPINAIVDYTFGNFKLLVTSAPVRTVGPIAPEVTALVGDAAQLTIASFNVENLAPANGAAKFNALAGQVVTNLRSPDVVALMEVQDNNGATSGSVVDASITIQTLIDAIRSAGGPAYAYRQINPVADADGGEPGGNIRQVFLYNPLRVSFTDRANPAPSTTAVAAVPVSPTGVRLSVSPGRIDPSNTAWAASRKPLVGEFVFNGKTFFMIANHFNSKGGDTDLFGRFQPPQLVSQTQRVNQATLVANFVNALRAADASANVIVLGDLNDFEFSAPLTVLKNAGLFDMIETLPANERYTYVYAGNSQALDHIMLTNNLKAVSVYDVVHVNSEFAAQVSDHEPEVVRIKFGKAAATGPLTPK